ncbi:MAG TPA: response regulator transcription factor [Gaiellales bacterium]|nr:response regulator transcription factor [Gaiellales bacterium]
MAWRVLVADDHEIVRRGVRLVLDAQPDFRVVADVADGAEAVVRAVRDDVDLAVLDVRMPKMSGLQVTAELARRRPSLRIVILSMYDDEQFLFEALKAGASGYVLKSAVDKDIVEACRAAMRGETFLYPSVLASLVRDRIDGDRLPDGVEPLTAREVEVLKLIAEGNSAKEIARMLVISVKTVERHRSNILEKLGLRDRVELTRFAIRRGLVQP